jgi:mannosylglycoprotein endo-beta-mannosidase
MEGNKSSKQTRWSGGLDNCNFNFATLNVRGLASNKIKRLSTFDYMKNKGDICFLQETHSTKDTEKQWRQETGCESYFSHGASNARGVMIFFKESIEVEINEQTCDDNGRFLMLTCNIQGAKFLLYNVYAPNNESEHKAFIEYIKEKILSVKTDDYDYVIGAGDWNFTSENIDRKGGNYTNWKNNIEILEEINEKLDTLDIWRVKNPEMVRYTWRGKVRGERIQSRLDRIYISDTMQYNISKTDILPGFNSDHSMPVISIKPTHGLTQSGPNFWKFNNSLLKNENFTKGLEKYIKTDLAEECMKIKSKQVKWEYTKFKIKNWSMTESKAIACEKRKSETVITAKIKSLEESLEVNRNDSDQAELESLQTKLEEIYNAKTQSLIIQSRVQVYEEGEKSTSFFLNQIKQNKRKSTIRKLMDGPKELVDQQTIMKKLNDFYSNLYTADKKCRTGSWIKNLRGNGLIPQLSEVESESLEKPLTKKELQLILEKCANNKSPGNDGLTKEFYLHFWSTIQDALFDSYLESIRTGKLSTSQRQNIITLLEKAGKDKTLIKNWRPISLINFDTKLFSKTYAERLKQVMPSLVHPNQVAYVKDRFIGEGLRTIDETMDYTKRKQIEAYAIAVDFEKAFDSIDWNYLWEALASYNIPSSFIDMMKLLYNDIESCVTNNGTSTPYFKITRGVRQGDPIAAYLFTLAIELLAINIRNNSKIIGIKVNDTEIKLSMYADDLTGLVVGIKSIKELMSTIHEFKNYSGLSVNCDKTELMTMGISEKNDNITKLGYKIVDEINITGMYFTYNKDVFIQKNYNAILISIDKMLNIWKQRNLSILGKVQIIKTFGILKLIFIFNMSDPPADVVQKANNMFYKFLWNGPDKMKRLSAISDIENGGIKMPHLSSIIDALKIVWVKRYSMENYHPWKEFLKNGLEETCGYDIINRKLPTNVINSIEISQFNRKMLNVWNQFQKEPQSEEEKANQYLWYNANITKPNGQTICYPGLSKLGINYVKDTILNGKVINAQHINDKDISWKRKFELMSTIKCIPKMWKDINFSESIPESISSRRLSKITTKNISKSINETIQIQPTSEQFFIQELNVSSIEMKEYYGIPFRTTIYTKLRSFQFKVNHNIIFTNEKLHKIGYVSSDLCTFCNKYSETLGHLFVDCQKVKELWSQVTQTLLSPYGIEQLSKKDILLGIICKEHQNNVINHILIEAKYYIYMCKLEETVPVYSRLKNRLKITESIEREIAHKTWKKTKQHTYKWHHLMEYLLDT